MMIQRRIRKNGMCVGGDNKNELLWMDEYWSYICIRTRLKERLGEDVEYKPKPVYGKTLLLLRHSFNHRYLCAMHFERVLICATPVYARPLYSMVDVRYQKSAHEQKPPPI